MIFAWAIKGHWIGPLIGIVILITGMYYIYQGGQRKMLLFAGQHADRSCFIVFLYLADAYTIYASSAMSTQSAVRNGMGFVFPLFVTQMCKSRGRSMTSNHLTQNVTDNTLGYSWASFLMAMIGFILATIRERISAGRCAALRLTWRSQLSSSGGTEQSFVLEAQQRKSWPDSLRRSS